jgi:hypothetical protein
LIPMLLISTVQQRPTTQNIGKHLRSKYERWS